jgi:hypothetical protein
MNEEKLSIIPENNVLINFKYLLLGSCIEESIILIEKGIEFFRKISMGNDNIAFLSFLFLSRGFELLMKNILVFKYIKENKKFLSSKELRKYNHNLIKLRDEILKNYDNLKIKDEKIKEYIDEDNNLLQKKELNDILEVFNEYASGEGRYYAFESLDSNNIYELKNPLNQFYGIILENIENSKSASQRELQGDQRNIDRIWNRIIKSNLTPLIYKFLRALTRQFAYGILGDKGLEMSNELVSKYAYMKNKDILLNSND